VWGGAISKTVGEKWHDEGRGESAIAWRMKDELAVQQWAVA